MTPFKNLYWLFHIPVQSRIEYEQQYLTERMEVLNSSLWDERYYFRQYGSEVRETGLFPLDHYLQTGWKLGYNPSAYFDGKNYLERYPFVPINPLVHFLRYGRQNYCVGFSRNVYSSFSCTLEKYFQLRSDTNKKVIYTCITNDYDEIEAIACPYYVDPAWDYVCFSDNDSLVQKKQIGVWEIRPLVKNDFDTTRNNRYHKILPHRVLSEYDESIYIDANINILTDYVFRLIQKHQPLFVPVHLTKTCLYHEAEWILQTGIDKVALEEQLRKYRQEGFPKNYGLTENNLIYRKHQNPKVVAMMEEWWEWVRDYCRRDQASFSYVLWKHHQSVEDIGIVNTRLAYQDFCVFLHAKSRGF